MEILKYNFISCVDEDYKFIHVDKEENIYNGDLSELEIDKIISGINVKKATGFDRISGDMIELIYNVNKKVFVDLLNKICASQRYPESWKIEVVALIPKEGKDSSLKDIYRPISLLPIWGKV